MLNGGIGAKINSPRKPLGLMGLETTRILGNVYKRGFSVGYYNKSSNEEGKTKKTVLDPFWISKFEHCLRSLIPDGFGPGFL